MSTLYSRALSVAPVMRYVWPTDSALVNYLYWRPTQAAKVWGCSYQAARCWLLRHPQYAIRVELVSQQGDLLRYLWCMRAGQERLRQQPGTPGNPCFRDPEYQAELATRRWLRPHLEPLPGPDDPPWG